MIERILKLLKPKDLIVEDKLEASKTVGGRAVRSVADEPAARNMVFAMRSEKESSRVFPTPKPGN